MLEANGSAGVPEDSPASEEPSGKAQEASAKSPGRRGLRGLREILSLGQPEVLLTSGGRPSRRAATAAQAAVAHTIAFERSKGNQMSPPKPIGEMATAQRILSAVESTPKAAAVSLQPSSTQGTRKGSKRPAPSASPAVAASGASSAAGGADTPSASGANGLLSATLADEASDLDNALTASNRKRRPPKKRATTASRKSRAAAGPSAAPSEQAVLQASQPAEEATPFEPPTAAESVQAPAPMEVDGIAEAAAASAALPVAAAAADASGSSPESAAAAVAAAAAAAAAVPSDPDEASTRAGDGKSPASERAQPAAAVPAAVTGVPAAPADQEPAADQVEAQQPAVKQEVAQLATEQPAAEQPGAEKPGEEQPAAVQQAAAAQAPVQQAAAKQPKVEPAAEGASKAPSAAAAHAALHVPPEFSHMPAEVVRLAALIRSALGLPRGQQANLRMVMKAGLLAGQEVRFQNKAGKVLNKGVMNEQGFISCFCPKCNGKSASCSEFEEHAGSRDRRPADGIFLIAHNVSMRDLVSLVNTPEMAAGVDVHMEVCYSCKEGGDLLCCDGCTAAFHLGCVSLEAVPEGDWFCPVCMSEGRSCRRPPPVQMKPAKSRPTARSKHQSAKTQTSGGDGDSDGVAATSRPRKADGCTSPVGRVHMAAPTMGVRRPGGVRRGRNSNKHKRLFEGGEGSLPNGEKVAYITTQGERLLEGEVVISARGPSGILCYCCNQVISCSQFEAHAGRGSRRAPYDNIFTSAGLTLKAIAAMLPDLEEEQPQDGGAYDLSNIVDGCREVINELDTLAGGCCLCHEVDFQRGGFGPRTILFCDQCEREFHVGCLKKAGTCDLQAVPEGDWFCSEQCTDINRLLGTFIQAGQMEIPESPGHTWQLLRGKDGTHATSWSLRAAQELLQESFDPIMDLSTNTDLLPLMIYARQYGEWDYKNVHVMLLRHKGKPVVAAIMRVFGPQLAELPLIATKLTARRQGHARVLLKVFDELLARAKVHRLCLPAAHETVLTWRQGFHFLDMPEEEVKLAKQQLRILVFPGTEMLWKEVPGVVPPSGHHVLVAPPEQEKPAGAAAAAAAPDGAQAGGAAGAAPVAPEGSTGPGGAAPQQLSVGWEGGAAGAYPPQPAQGGVAAAVGWPGGSHGAIGGLGAEAAVALQGGPSAGQLAVQGSGMAAHGYALPPQPSAVGAPAGQLPQWHTSLGAGVQQQQQQQLYQQQQRQQVWGGVPITQPAAAAMQASAAYSAAAALPYVGGAYRPASSQAYRQLQAAQPLPSAQSAPQPSADPFLDSYEQMFASAMLAADTAAERPVVQPPHASGLPAPRLQQPPFMARHHQLQQAEQQLSSPALLPTQQQLPSPALLPTQPQLPSPALLPTQPAGPQQWSLASPQLLPQQPERWRLAPSQEKLNEQPWFMQQQPQQPAPLGGGSAGVWQGGFLPRLPSNGGEAAAAAAALVGGGGEPGVGAAAEQAPTATAPAAGGPAVQLPGRDYQHELSGPATAAAAAAAAQGAPLAGASEPASAGPAAPPACLANGSCEALPEAGQAAPPQEVRPAGEPYQQQGSDEPAAKKVRLIDV